MFDSLQAIKNHKKVNYLTNKGKVDITHLINFDFAKKILEKVDLKINGPHITRGIFKKNWEYLNVQK